MKALLRACVIAVGWFVLLIAVGLVVVLTLSSAIGYLPYSDRPGPGWVGPSFSLDQLAFYASFGVFLLYPTALYGTILFAFHRLLRYLGAPSLLIRLVAAVSAGIVALMLTAGVGWFIAIAAFPVWVAGALGGVWGGVILPRYLGPPRPSPGPPQWAAIILLLLVAGYGGRFNFFAPGYEQTVQVNVVRVTPSATAPPLVDRLPALDTAETALLDSLFPHARVERGMTGASTTGSGGHSARLLIVMTGPLTATVRLRVPKGVAAAYIQSGDQWRLYPVSAPTLHDRVTLAPGARPDDWTIAWPGGEPSPFTWRDH